MTKHTKGWLFVVFVSFVVKALGSCYLSNVSAWTLHGHRAAPL
jgi:hypothetical protein